MSVIEEIGSAVIAGNDLFAPLTLGEDHVPMLDGGFHARVHACVGVCGIGVWDLGSRGYGVRVQGLGLWVWALGFEV